MTGAAIGVDAGSATLKSVLVDAQGQMIDSIIEATQPRMGEQASLQIAALIRRQGGDAAKTLPVIATGYGRRLVQAASEQVTEITCHACGIFHALGHGGTLIDVGGQDSKVIVIGERGQVLDFAMNDKCAAGTGRFLEHSAQRLGMTLDELSDERLRQVSPATISSTCTVFAESEIVSLLADGVAADAIACGLQQSLSARLVGLVKSLGFRPPLMMSGGVARNQVLRHFLAQALAYPIAVPAQPQLIGAFGAALLALQRTATREERL